MNLKDLPDVLKPLESGIKTSLKPYIVITAQRATDLPWWQSKFGGLPYLPKNQPYPVDSDNRPLMLLAQFNFAEIPALENFPDKGILQFYIATDDLYGADFDQPLKQDGFRVIYFEDIEQDERQLVTDFSFLPFSADQLTPLTGEYTLKFEQKIAPVAIGDFSFARFMRREAYGDEENADEIYDTYSDYFSSTGHKLGGYPFFTQSDPREYDKGIQDYILLFQMDSDYDYQNDTTGKDILWGDVGVANFFIRLEDLKNKDFSKVLYNWDCS